MVSSRPLLAALTLSFVACGGGGGGNVVPEGMHTHYVANKVFVPTNNNQAREYGLDLNGDGTVDNQLGMVLGTLAGMGFDIQNTIDKAVAEGNVILLVDFQTKDFTNTSAAGLEVYLGSSPMPAACNTGETYCNTATPPVCTGCQHHLQGTGAFTAMSNGMNVALAGPIVSGTFKGGPGNLTLQIALAAASPITLNLIGARTQASGITATAIGSAVLAGALTQDDLNTKVIPAIQQQLVPIIQRDCCGAATSPGGATCNVNATPPCGCKDGTTGKTILGLFDTMPKDCAVTVDEIKNNSLIQSLLAPDVTIDGKMALSLGIKTTETSATFTTP